VESVGSTQKFPRFRLSANRARFGIVIRRYGFVLALGN
jgi:hypothetical protein